MPITDQARLRLVSLHQGRVACHVGEHNGSEAPYLFFDHGKTIGRLGSVGQIAHPIADGPPRA